MQSRCSTSLGYRIDANEMLIQEEETEETEEESKDEPEEEEEEEEEELVDPKETFEEGECISLFSATPDYTRLHTLDWDSGALWIDWN